MLCSQRRALWAVTQGLPDPLTFINSKTGPGTASSLKASWVCPWRWWSLFILPSPSSFLQLLLESGPRSYMQQRQKKSWRQSKDLKFKCIAWAFKTLQTAAYPITHRSHVQDLSIIFPPVVGVSSRASSLSARRGSGSVPTPEIQEFRGALKDWSKTNNQHLLEEMGVNCQLLSLVFPSDYLRVSKGLFL